MVEILKNDVNTTNTFLLTFNGQNERLDEGIQQMVRIIDRGSVMTIWTPPPSPFILILWIQKMHF